MAQPTTLRHLFLRIYSNGELGQYLSAMLEQGWVIHHCKGNFLFFQRRPLPRARLLAITTECTQRDPKGDEQVDEYIQIALGKKWQLLCIGDLESVLPARRRLYFYTQDPDAVALEPDTVIDFQYAHRAYHTTLRWWIVWTVLLLAALLTTIPFMAYVGPQPPFLLIDAALLILTVSACVLFWDRRGLYRHVTRQTPWANRDLKRFRRWESILAGSLFALLVGLVWLLLVFNVPRPVIGRLPALFRSSQGPLRVALWGSYSTPTPPPPLLKKAGKTS